MVVSTFRFYQSRLSTNVSVNFTLVAAQAIGKWVSRVDGEEQRLQKLIVRRSWGAPISATDKHHVTPIEPNIIYNERSKNYT